MKNNMIISCSRRTDIPAFYSDWFFNRLHEGFALVRNPMNPKQVRQVSLAPPDVDCIIFWTKDPAPMLDSLNLLQDYNYYFQFALTPYDKDIEPNLPPKTDITDTFLKLFDKIGKKRIVWRYDPILLSASISIDYHMDHFHDLASVDMGEYNTCGHSCRYCYANVSQKKLEKNHALHHSILPSVIKNRRDV